MSNVQTTNSVETNETATAKPKSGYLNVVKRGWGRLLRVRTVKAKRSKDLPTLHAFVAFDDGDGVDCVVSGEAAKAMIQSLESVANAPAPEVEEGQKQSKYAHYVDVAVDVSDCFTTTYQGRGDKTMVGRKGRLLKVRQLVVDGISTFDDQSETFQQAQTSGGGYLRNVRTYTANGDSVVCVTVQFAHGKTGENGELQWDAHQLDVLDPKVLDIVAQFKDLANAKKPEAASTDKAKPYLNSVWVSVKAVDCQSSLRKNARTGDEYVLRTGVLLEIGKVIVNGVVQYQAQPPTSEPSSTEPTDTAQVSAGTGEVLGGTIVDTSYTESRIQWED